MQRLGFLASFFAVFLTFDNQFLDGSIARYTWNTVNTSFKDAEVKLSTWARRH